MYNDTVLGFNKSGRSGPHSGEEPIYIRPAERVNGSRFIHIITSASGGRKISLPFAFNLLLNFVPHLSPSHDPG
jgi:hypothetical protein